MEAALGATVSKGDAEKAIRLAQLLADEADARAEAAEAREAELRADVRAACDRLSEGRDGIPATGPMWSHGVVYAVREFRALAGEKVELALTGEDE